MKNLLIRFTVVLFGLLVMNSCNNDAAIEAYSKLDSLQIVLNNEKKANDSLKLVIASLNEDIDELKNGEARMIGIIESDLSSKKYQKAKDDIYLLFEKHPETTKRDYYTNKLKTINIEIDRIKREQEIHRQDSIKLANLNNLGIWDIDYFVDEFGEPTKEPYITTKNPIYGSFSNSATEGSRLRVQFIIANNESVAIKLFEYDRSNPVKKSYYVEYNVLVQDKDGNKYNLSAFISGDRLRFGWSYDDYKDARKMHNILKKGGKIKFKITEIKHATTQYNFEIDNADWYENAYTKLSYLSK